MEEVQSLGSSANTDILENSIQMFMDGEIKCFLHHCVIEVKVFVSPYSFCHSSKKHKLKATHELNCEKEQNMLAELFLLVQCTYPWTPAFYLPPGSCHHKSSVI